MLRHTVAATLFVLLLAAAPRADAHCQVPCGIYHDKMRVDMIREDIETVEKAVGQIQALAGKRDAQSANQLNRWVSNKELHAEKIIRTISDYFMAQKIKPVDPRDKRGFAAYQEMLTRHHVVMVAAMKCKQSAAPGDVTALKKAVDAIAGYWKK